jgi:antitoxin component YwqK of YwqJK toxin-antitoxin module
MSLENAITIIRDYYVNDQLHRQKSCRNGKLMGERKFWFTNGQLWHREFFRDGVREGKCQGWHQDGTPYIQSFYRNGKIEGEKRTWYRSGCRSDQIFYRNAQSIDENFTLRKKLVILRFRKLIQNRETHPINTFLISDLEQTVHW